MGGRGRRVGKKPLLGGKKDAGKDNPAKRRTELSNLGVCERQKGNRVLSVGIKQEEGGGGNEQSLKKADNSSVCDISILKDKTSRPKNPSVPRRERTSWQRGDVGAAARGGGIWPKGTG